MIMECDKRSEQLPEDDTAADDTRNVESILRRTPASASTAAVSNHHEVPKKQASERGFCRVVQRISWQDVFFIASWGIFGTVVRVYIGRLFGGDCETKSSDFWDASSVCITANGMTSRRGGALFIDLPANIFGSLFMGILSASTEHPIPWLPEDHHLQRHSAWQKGLTTGFCGCLTTFASWNTQMVAMLDGTEAENGSQILSAMFGYVIGLLTAIAAFLWGRVLARMMRNSRSNGVVTATTFDENEEHGASDCEGNHVESLSEENSVSASEKIPCPSPTNENVDSDERSNEQVEDETCLAEDNSSETSLVHLGGSILTFGTLLVTLALLLGFLYGDVASDYIFYRRMWMTCLCTPIGAITRNKLKQWLPTSHSVEWGTWMANIVGSVLSVLLLALTVRFLSDDQQDSWLGTFLWALQVGFAGSLSTVSTFVKELIGLERLIDRHLYGVITLLVAMSLGLAVYSPIVRS